MARSERPDTTEPDTRPVLVAPRSVNPFGTSAPTPAATTGLVSVEQQRQIAEVQARMIVARNFPRDPLHAMDMILQDCTRPTLAEKALYNYARAGTEITGPTIRLAEAIAQRWGNLASGIKELSRHNGYSECVAYAWDLETGYYDERQFQVRHWRDTKGGGYQLNDERDIYELTANLGQRRKRAVLLTVIPGDVVEAALDACEKTLHAKADTSPEAIRKMLEVFAAMGVSRAQIETRIQRRVETIRPAQVIQLRKIYNSISDGMSEIGDWFEVGPATAATAETSPETTEPLSSPEGQTPGQAEGAPQGPTAGDGTSPLVDMGSSWTPTADAQSQGATSAAAPGPSATGKPAEPELAQPRGGPARRAAVQNLFGSDE
jgi:hypothetical protein